MTPTRKARTWEAWMVGIDGKSLMLVTSRKVARGCVTAWKRWGKPGVLGPLRVRITEVLPSRPQSRRRNAR